MTLNTLLAFLAGDRRAIQQIASARHVIWIGLLLVFSVALAREYDGQDLLHEPWHLAVPLAASLVSSLVLYVLVAAIAAAHGNRPDSFLRGYPTFLSLYWMTAPLAWVYAIPVERLLSADQAVIANLVLLGLVASWRVLLMARVVAVLVRCHFLAAFCVVMLFADLLALVLLHFTPLPVVSIMGGVRQTAGEQVVQWTAQIVGLLGIVTLPVWLFAAGAVVRMGRRGAWRRWDAVVPTGAAPPVPWAWWGLAAITVLGGIALLPVAQPEQQNRRHAERLLLAGQVREAVDYMTARDRGDFPPHWDPPPWIGYGQHTPPLIDVLDAALQSTTDSEGWVRKIFIHKLTFYSDTSHWRNEPLIELSAMDDVRLARYVGLLQRLGEEGPRIAATYQLELAELFPEPWSESAETPAGMSIQRHRLLGMIHGMAAPVRDGPSESQEPARP